LALQLAESLLPDRRDDPDYALAYAAAQAANGNFATARGTQERAIFKAKRLGWALGPLQETLKKYESGEMDSTVPAEFKEISPLAHGTAD
jgi:hypothetical protein